MKHTLLAVLAALSLTGCVKDRVLDLSSSSSSGGIAPGVLKVNEFIAAGSPNANEFGTTSDWLEIYNPADTTFNLRAGQWYASDDLTTPRKYALPALSIPGHGFLVIWCDGLDTVATQVHTNFSLSSAGEDVLLYYEGGGHAFEVDSYTFPAVTNSGSSTGRLPDGGATWTTFSTPTPGASNH